MLHVDLAFLIFDGKSAVEDGNAWCMIIATQTPSLLASHRTVFATEPRRNRSSFVAGEDTDVEQRGLFLYVR